MPTTFEGHLEAYWKSPELLVVIDSEQVNGWQQLHDSYVKGYPDRSAMGFIEPGRVQVKLLKPDFALALTWWTINFPSSKQKVVGNTTMNLQKFDDGWKIVASHSSTTEIWEVRWEWNADTPIHRYADTTLPARAGLRPSRIPAAREG
jgi:hypothetical protein